VCIAIDGRPEGLANLCAAIYRDEDKIHSYRGAQAGKSSIDIYSCAGKLLRRINVCLSSLFDLLYR
jgi:hypothetical protein